MSVNTNNLILRPIWATDDTEKLSLGNQAFVPLKIFLSNDAFNFHRSEIAKTYVLVDPQAKQRPRIWGYITLMCSEIEINLHQLTGENSRLLQYKVFPAIKIARLAVDKVLQRQGYGKGLLDFSIGLILQKIMPHVGCRFIVVDSKKDSVSFYQQCGFELLDTSSNIHSDQPLMFFDLRRNTQ